MAASYAGNFIRDPDLYRPMKRIIALTSALVLFLVARQAYAAKPVAAPPGEHVPTVDEAIAARTDVWGDAAMRQPNGASYEFFRDLMPPLRWVNTEFRHYPIVLSAPLAAQKTRLVSNGSAVAARANKPPMWFEQGTPIRFFVGETAESFGENLKRLETPELLNGYLPVITIRYQAGAGKFSEEVFAPVDQASAEYGMAMLRFSLADAGTGSGRIEARFDAEGGCRVKGRLVLNKQGECVAAFGPDWRWQEDRSALVAKISPDHSAELATYSKPGKIDVAVSRDVYELRKVQCIEAWEKLLSRGAHLTVPEPIVNDAWRALVVGNFMTVVGDKPNYSAGNAYGHLYEAECGDTLRSFLLYGQWQVGPGMLKSMLEFNRKDTQFHVAGQKLQLVAYYYWLTRDAETIRKLAPLWNKSVELILNSREAKSGLLPKDRYAGDISTKVYSLNSNANCWRGLRDLAAALDDMGSHDQAKNLRSTATEYRAAILKAVDQSENRDVKPAYIPIALLAGETPPDPLTATQLGSYYDLICPYMINSEIFGQGSEREDSLLGYMQNHGGISMGMVRTEPHQGQFKGGSGVVPLYALRYQLTLLRRDEREKALVGFYGHLAQGMTRGTFIGGEGCRFQVGGDANGRSLYLPPNSTSNAAWLIELRYLLVQDWDLDEDGVPETLRLLYGAPRLWLADGKKLHFDSLPTMFGQVALDVESKLASGYVEVHMTPPARVPKKLLLRAPVPAGWQVASAEIDGKIAPLVGGNAVDLTGNTAAVTVKFAVRAAAAN